MIAPSRGITARARAIAALSYAIARSVRQIRAERSEDPAEGYIYSCKSSKLTAPRQRVGSQLRAL